MGEALGNIIPTIITHHIANISAKSTGVHGIGIELIAPATMSGMSGIDASIPAIWPIPCPARWSRYSHETALTPISDAMIGARSRSASPADDGFSAGTASLIGIPAIGSRQGGSGAGA